MPRRGLPADRGMLAASATGRAAVVTESLRGGLASVRVAVEKNRISTTKAHGGRRRMPRSICCSVDAHPLCRGHCAGDGRGEELATAKEHLHHYARVLGGDCRWPST